MPNPVNWTMDEVRSRCEEFGDCLLWQRGLSAKSVPAVCIGGKMKSVRELVLNLNGRTRKPGRALMARCGNRLCVAEACIAQRTQKEVLAANQEKRSKQADFAMRNIKQFRDAGLVKLNPAIAAEIRASGLSSEEEAAKWKVSRRTINRIRRGELWAPMRNSSIFNLGG